MDNNGSFEYTYSAQRQQEVEAIRRAYLPKAEDNLDKLRKLHGIPTRKAQAASLSVGILGALVLGTGMSLCMTELGAGLGPFAMAAGIVTGIVGMGLIALAYPVYRRTLRKEREKIAPEILQLADRLMQ